MTGLSHHQPEVFDCGAAVSLVPTSPNLSASHRGGDSPALPEDEEVEKEVMQLNGDVPSGVFERFNSLQTVLDELGF